MKFEVSAWTGQRSSLTESLGREVLRLIKAEELGPGDRLPSVKKLAERFSVATPTMREALRLLQMAGNIDIRHGSGIYVRDGISRLVLANPYPGDLDVDTILNLLRTRLLIEPPVAELSAIAGTEGAFDELEGLLAEAERHLAGDQVADGVLGLANMKFHRVVVGG